MQNCVASKKITIYYFLVSLILSISFCHAHSQDAIITVTHYLFPEFTKGTILMKTGTKQDIMLNYNSLTAEMVFEEKGQKLAIGNEAKLKIDTIFIHNRKFVVVNNTFLELLHHADFLVYAEHKCRLTMPGSPVGYGGTSHTASVTSLSSLNTDGRFYQLKLPNDYQTNAYTHYWIKKNGKMTEVANMRQLRRLYSNKRAEYNTFTNQHDVSFEDTGSIVQLIQFLESN